VTLTIRLDATLEAALESHCLATGTAKSLVVRESLAHYLLAHKTPGALPAKGGKGASGRPPEPSANYRAFAEAGLIGAVALGQGADKAAVRAKVAERFAERKARRRGV
jgi:hypothetical protein